MNAKVTDCPMIQREHFRRAEDPWRLEIAQDIGTLKSQHAEIRKAVDENTAITTDIKANTDEMVDLFKAAKGFFVMAGYFGKVAKWVGAIAAAITAVWAAMRLNR